MKTQLMIIIEITSVLLLFSPNVAIACPPDCGDCEVRVGGNCVTVGDGCLGDGDCGNCEYCSSCYCYDECGGSEVCCDDECEQCCDDNDCGGQCESCVSGVCINDDDKCTGCESCNNGYCEDDDYECDGCCGCEDGECEDDDSYCSTCYYCDDCECICTEVTSISGISGPYYKSQSTTVTANINHDDLPEGCTISWYGDATFTNKNGKTATATFNSVGSGKTIAAKTNCQGSPKPSSSFTVVEVASVTSNKNFACVGCDVIFTVTTNPSGHANLVTWSGGGTPSTQAGGATFTTKWTTSGNKTVIASCGSSSKSKQVTIAAPTNFHETYREEKANGELRFEYAWDSTSGNLAHLADWQVGEKLDFPNGNPYFWPSPPWNCYEYNPAMMNISASYGALADTHYPGIFIKPYEEASFITTQVYRYCDYYYNYTNVMGPLSISRYVSGGGPWRYSITKCGAYAEIFPLP